MEIDETKMVNWLDYFSVNYDFEIKNQQKTFVRRHVSGHASQSELKTLIEKIKPKIVIPIHTTHPKLFQDISTNKVILPKYAKPIEI